MVARSLTGALPAPRGLELGESGETGPATWIAAGLEAALKARTPALYASTPLVVQLARRVGRELALDGRSQALLEISARIRDIGMLGLPDQVVLNTKSLTPADWELVNRHPILGAELLESLSPVAAAAPIVRSHHERWDGEGYPDGRRGDAIPLLSRVIAICDAFVAVASDRPYRRGAGMGAALDYIRLERDAQFDPRTADAFVAALAGTGGGRDLVGGANSPKDGGRTSTRSRDRAPGHRDLASVIAEFDAVATFAPAYEQADAANNAHNGKRADLVAAIESDTGLTVAVLRKAQTISGHRPAANVPDAVAALSADEIQDAIGSLPRAQFPWRTSPLEVLMHHSRIHAQAVSRAADRIAREVKLAQSEDLLIAALLHDIGKLALSRVGSDYYGVVDTRRASPEERVRNEQRTMGIDHATLGAELLRRWGLPAKLASTVGAHHTSEDKHEVATYLRLADMVAHHAQGDTVDRTIMLRVARACDLSTKALRDVMFDLPHSGGSRRRRAESSPLSTRETEVIRLLAQGKPYKLIAAELGVAVSTVRTHLHNTYDKLGVSDRALAVLRASEMGWI